MAKPMFIWLGAGRARRRKVGPRGAWLDMAANAGLPVPAGALLLEEFHQFALDHGLLASADNRLLIPDPELLVNTILYSLRVPLPRGPLGVRPVFSLAEQADIALPAGAGETIADPADPPAFAAALRAAWAAALPTEPPGLRHDVLLLQQLPATQTGSSLSRAGADADLVYAAATETPIRLARLSRWGRPDPAAPAHLGRLQMLLRGLRRTLGAGNYRIDWADDGAVCRLTRIEPE